MPGKLINWTIFLICLSLTTQTQAFDLFSNGRTTTIEEIKQHAKKYDEDTIIVRGQVSKITKIPMLKAYSIKDDSGEIWVITDKKLPEQGEQLSIRCQVENIVIFGQKSMGLHLRELQRL